MIFSTCCSATAAGCLRTAFSSKADAYYHSGYYPTIFDNNAAFKTPHMAEDTGTVVSHNTHDEANSGIQFHGRAARLD